MRQFWWKANNTVSTENKENIFTSIVFSLNFKPKPTLKLDIVIIFDDEIIFEIPYIWHIL